MNARTHSDIEIFLNFSNEKEINGGGFKVGQDLLMRLDMPSFSGESYLPRARVALIYFQCADLLSDWTLGSLLYGLAVDNIIVDYGEAYVRASRNASLGQIATKDECRGLGFARAIVRCICSNLLAEGFYPH